MNSNSNYDSQKRFTFYRVPDQVLLNIRGKFGEDWAI